MLVVFVSGHLVTKPALLAIHRIIAHANLITTERQNDWRPLSYSLVASCVRLPSVCAGRFWQDNPLISPMTLAVQQVKQLQLKVTSFLLTSLSLAIYCLLV